MEKAQVYFQKARGNPGRMRMLLTIIIVTSNIK